MTFEEIHPDALPGAPDGFDACEADDGAEHAGLAGGAMGLLGPTQRPITWLRDAFDLWGVRYAVVSGWEDRGRPPSRGAFRPNGSILIHHTGSTTSASNPHPALGVVTKGRPDLSGPLCQISTGYDGVTRIVAAGRANHAGKARVFGVNPAGDGNAMYIGNEVDTNGTQQMPAAQYDAVVLSSAAILHHYGVKPSQVGDYLGLHASTSLSGKWDLGAGTGKAGVPYPRRDLVRDVAARLTSGPPSKVPAQPVDASTPTPAKPVGGFLMALTDQQQTDLYARVMGALPKGNAAGRTDPSGAPSRVLTTAEGDYLRQKIEGGVLAATAAGDGVEALTAKVDALTTAVAELAAKITPPPPADGGTA